MEGYRSRERAGHRSRVRTYFGYIDLPLSQESSLGQSLRIALGPAIRLTWPPFSITSSLSVEPTVAIRCLAAS